MMCEINLQIGGEKSVCMTWTTIILARGIIGEDGKNQIVGDAELEKWIEFILEHEVLHIVLEQYLCPHISDELDKVNIGDCKMNKLVWRIKKNNKEMIL